MIKFSAILYVGFIIGIIVLADHGMLPRWMTGCAEFPYGDNVGHFLLFGILSMVCTVATRFKRVRFFSPLFLGCAVTLLLVTLEEVSQLFIPARTFSLSDLFADSLGIGLIGQLFCSKWLKLWHSIPKCLGEPLSNESERNV